MTGDKIIEVADKYRQTLLDLGAVRERSPETPNQNHLLWMCGQLHGTGYRPGSTG